MNQTEYKYTLHHGDCRVVLRQLQDASVQTCVTSPPFFGLRHYCDGEIGVELSPDDYVAALVEVFRKVRHILRDDGTVWLNLGDSYANVGKWGGSSGGKHAKNLHGNTGVGREKHDYGILKNKDAIGIPWKVAFALQADGWYLRQDLIWVKNNAMPSPVDDRCTTAHEYIFLLSKSKRYYFDTAAIRESAAHGGLRNCRSVWHIPAQSQPGHHAAFPPELVRRCVLAGSRVGDLVLDPFNGSGTTGEVALAHSRHYVGIDLNAEYVAMTEARLATVQPLPICENLITIPEKRMKLLNHEN